MRDPNRKDANGNKTPEYRTWTSIRYRCNNPNSKDYPLYGGREIRVEWETFNEFLNDMGKRPEGYSIERLDNDKNYCKENCCWIPMSNQFYNRRTNLTPETKYLVKVLRNFYTYKQISKFAEVSEGSVCNLLKD